MIPYLWCSVRPSYWQACDGPWSMCVALLCHDLAPWPSCQHLVQNSEMTRTPKWFNLSTCCPCTLLVSLPHCTGKKQKKQQQSSPTWLSSPLIWIPCLLQSSCSTFSQLSDDALSPSYLTQVMGSTFDKCKHTVFISEDLENVVGFYENLWLLLKYQTYLHREMFFMCCFTYINTFQ